MEIVVGPPVTGENLYGRKRELDTLWSAIKNNNILLSSPRRFGKTSLVKEMERAPRDGFKVTYLDVEGICSVQDFVSDLVMAIPSSTRQTLLRKWTDVAEAIEEIQLPQIRIKLKESIGKDWRRKGTEALLNLGEKHVIVIDELPSFLLNLEASKDQNQTMGIFLRWMRGSRQSSQTQNIRFVLCGSIGIDNILRRHVLSNTTNDLLRIDVEPFNRDTATRMIEDLLDESDIEYESTHVERVLDKIGVPVAPYFVQVMLFEVSKMTDKRLSEEVIDKAYQNVLNGSGREYFDWSYDRLKTEFPPDLLQAALNILDHLSQHKSCTRSDLSRVFFAVFGKDDREKFLDVVRILESGFYIMKRDNFYSFRVKMLRDWWTERRVN